jgi:gluconolactonase
VNARISRTEHDGSVTVIVDRHAGGRLNSPNDIVVKSDATIWFTDPPYGIVSDGEGHRAESEQTGNHVFRFDPADGSLRIATDVIEEPNGLAFSPDEAILYVSDTSAAMREGTGNHHVVAFDVRDGEQLVDPRVFAVMKSGLPDGFRVDRGGNLFSSSADGIHVIAPDATPLGRIPVPEVVSNCAFGGRAGTTLFITASTSLYAIELQTVGAAATPAGAER